MIVLRGMGRGAVLGAIVVAGLGRSLAPTPAPTLYDIILRLSTNDGNICLWIPGEIDDCTPVTGGTTAAGDNSDYRPSRTVIDLRRIREQQEADDLEVIRAITVILNYI